MRRSAVLVLLLLPLSGCLGGGDGEAPAAVDAAPDLARLSQKVFDLLPVEETWVSASDGKGLYNAVYRPDTDEPVPVFINFSPYWGDTAELGGDNFARYLIDEYVPRGYAVVLAAIRGTGHSEGCFQIGGDREVRDLYETVDHFASQSWSNGNVAAGGKSYDSTPQNGLVAKMPHPALKGLFHVSGITDMYRYNYVNGVPYQQGPIFNTYYYLQGTDEYGASFLSTPSAEGAMSEDPDSLARVIDDAACTEFPQMQASGVGSGVTGLKDDYWVERDWTRTIGDSDWDGSIFFVHGLQDWNVKPDHILPWLDNLPAQVRVRGWLHQETDNGGHLYPMRADWNQTLLRWLDSELKGIDTGFWDEPAFDVAGTDGLWRRSDAWPPAQAGEPIPAADSEETTFVVGDDVVEAVWHLARNGSVRLSGAPTIHVMAASAGPDPVLTAVLYDRAPDGTEEWVGEAVLRGIYRNGLESPEPVTPVEDVQYHLTAYPMDLVLAEGHDLLVRFGDAARQSLTVTDETPSVFYRTQGATLEAVLSPADARADQPEPTPCFAC